MKRTLDYRTVAGFVALALGVAAHAREEPMPVAQKVSFDIKAPSMVQALIQFTQQSGLQLAFPTSGTDALSAPQVVGQYTPRAALDQLLANSGLEYEFANNRTVSVRLVEAAPRTAVNTARAAEDVGAIRLAESEHAATPQSEQEVSPQADLGRKGGDVPEVLVKGSRSLNMDIKRSRDDAQPYVVFDRSALENSGATDVQDFLKQRLTMNSTSFSPSQQLGTFTFGSASQVNLRGLGTNQTLILVDGRRLPSISAGGTPNQPDLNGIPISAVERIEILPTTASGIYGGSATGGVINVVLRHDYQGVEARAEYGNTFDRGAGKRGVDLSAGKTFEGGKTNVLFSGSWSDDAGLQVEDRDLRERGIDKIRANNPTFFANSSVPPLGATANIRSVSGAPLFGPGTPNFTSVPLGYAGGGGIAPLRANAGVYNFGLADSAQSGAQHGGLLGAAENAAIGLTVRREFTSRFSAFVDASGSRNRSEFPMSGFDFPLSTGVTIAANAPNNPFGQAIRVTVPSSVGDGLWKIETKQQRFAGGVIARLPSDWNAEADYTWGRASLSARNLSSATALSAAISNGSVDVLRDTTAFPLSLAPYSIQSYNSPYRSTTANTSLRLAGPLLNLPGGRPQLSTLVEHRKDQLGDGEGTSYSNSGAGTPFVPTRVLSQRSQSIDSAYLELKLPFVSERNQIPLVNELELQLAGRYDHYETRSASPSFAPGAAGPSTTAVSKLHSIDPTIGLRWSLIRDLTVRASYGTGFLPPSVNDLAPPLDPATAGAGGALVDPRRGNTGVGSAYQARTGSNPNLQPEESKSWSLGLVSTPRFLPGARLSLDYSRIEKTGNITRLTGQQLIDNEALFPDRVVRAAPAANDPFGVGRITFLDLTLLNGTRAEVDAIDMQLDYSRQTDHIGTFNFYTLATRQLHFKTQLTPSAVLLENTGITSNFPLEFKANAGVTWLWRDWTLGWDAAFYDSYLVADTRVASSAQTILNQGGTTVSSQLYHNVFGSYRLRGSGAYGFSGAEIRLGVRNVFNKRPPFDAASSSAGYYSGFGDPRLATYYLSVKTEF